MEQNRVLLEIKEKSRLEDPPDQDENESDINQESNYGNGGQTSSQSTGLALLHSAISAMEDESYHEERALPSQDQSVASRTTQDRNHDQEGGQTSDDDLLSMAQELPFPTLPAKSPSPPVSPTGAPPTNTTSTKAHLLQPVSFANTTSPLMMSPTTLKPATAPPVNAELPQPWPSNRMLSIETNGCMEGGSTPLERKAVLCMSEFPSFNNDVTHDDRKRPAERSPPPEFSKDMNGDMEGDSIPPLEWKSVLCMSVFRPSANDMSHNDRKRPPEAPSPPEPSKRSRITQSSNRVEAPIQRGEGLAAQPDNDESTSPPIRTDREKGAERHIDDGQGQQHLDGEIPQSTPELNQVEKPCETAEGVGIQPDEDEPASLPVGTDCENGPESNSDDGRGQQLPDGDQLQSTPELTVHTEGEGPEYWPIDVDAHEDLSEDEAISDADVPPEVYFTLTQYDEENSNCTRRKAVGFIAVESRDATLADLRSMIQNYPNLPKEWMFCYFPTLGPVAERHERDLGSVAEFLETIGDDSLGDGTFDNSFRLGIVIRE